MEAKMESLELEDNGEHRKGLPLDQPSLEASLASDEIYDDSPVCPRIGDQYQAGIPNLATEDEHHQLMLSPLDSFSFLGYDYPVGIGLAIPIMWASHPPSEVNKNEKELPAHHVSEAESKDSGRDKEGQVTPTDVTYSNTSECDSSYQAANPTPPANQVESGSSQTNDGKLAPCSSQECLNVSNKPTMQQREAERFTPLPGSSASYWSDAEIECFLLGLYIFGKNLGLVSKFVESKTMGDILSYYYGRFYKTDAYRRWSDCKKIRTRRCILGQRIFMGWRQQELTSRLQSTIPKETHDSLLAAFKSLNEGRSSFEEFVFILKSTVGMEAFVGAVGIGKGKHDLTGVVLDQARTNQVVSVRSEIPAGKACSSLASEDIIKFLTGDFRLSKTRSNDLFWEAVWPRLLARGWHSEQPKDLSTAKNTLVFLKPGIKKFSRRKLMKGTHYFDSVSDVLKKVAADPVLLELEVDGMDNGVIVDKNGWATDIKPDQNDLSDHQQQSYLRPRVPNCNQELLKFTVIDTSLVQGEGPFRVRELRSLPTDATVTYGPSHHSDKTRSSSSPEEQDSDDRSSDDQEDSEQGPAGDKNLEKVVGYTRGEDIQMDALQNLVAASSSVVPVNGHASDEQYSDISNGKGDEKDLTCFFGRRTKTARHEYLSPVSKRRRLTSCSNDRTSRRGFSFSKGDGLKKDETQLLSSSSKPIDVDAVDTCENKTSVNCSTKDRPDEKKNAVNSSTKDRPREEKMNAVNSSTKDRPHEEKMDAVNSSTKVRALKEKVNAADGGTCSKVNVSEIKVAKEEAQINSLIDLNKPNTPPDDETSTSICITSSDNQDCMKTDEDPSISDSKVMPDVPEATGNPVGVQPDQPSQMYSRRQGTRNRPPTARALEAVAFGLLGGTKRKSNDLKKSTSSRPARRARKTAESSVSMPTSTDRESSSIGD